MALKKAGSTAAAVAEAPAVVTPAPVVEQAINAAVATPMPKAAPKIAAPKDKAADKESYWTNKEERDIETGKRIRRSGVWQAALQSMAGLQFNQGGTVESYMELVDRIAEHGLNWVNKD